MKTFHCIKSGQIRSFSSPYFAIFGPEKTTYMVTFHAMFISRCFRSKKLGQKHVKKLYVFINMLLYWDQSCSDTIIVHFNPFQFSVAFHIETSQLICAANQMIVFYMKCNSGMNWVNHFFCLAKPKASELKRWWLYGNYKSIKCSKLTIITLEQSAKYVQS